MSIFIILSPFEWLYFPPENRLGLIKASAEASGAVICLVCKRPTWAAVLSPPVDLDQRNICPHSPFFLLKELEKIERDCLRLIWSKNHQLSASQENGENLFCCLHSFCGTRNTRTKTWGQTAACPTCSHRVRAFKLTKNKLPRCRESLKTGVLKETYG